MHITELLKSITPVQISNMIGDFNRLFAGGPCGPDSGSLSKTLSDTKKYRIVAWAVSDARLAAQEGELEYCHFLHGMAAAFYGLIRLIEAREMDKNLGPRLGMSAPTKKNHKSAGTPARKELSMAEVQTQFQFEDLVGFFVADGLKFMADEAKGVIATGFGAGKSCRVHLMAQVNERCKMMFLSFDFPMSVPCERRVEMAEAIARANYGLLIGRFEMDMGDGELGFQIAVPIDEVKLSHSQFRHCIAAALFAIERYGPAFFAVVFNNTSAEDAIDKCDE